MIRRTGFPTALNAATSRQAAIFYIHPTTYLARDRWNAPLQPGGETEFRTHLFVQSQASAFNGAGEIWAPRYRQAAFGAFLLESEDAAEGARSRLCAMSPPRSTSS